MSVDNNVASWTSALLIRDVRKRARLPSNDVNWTDTDILRAASEQLWSFAGWALANGGDGRLLTTYDRAVAASLPSPSRPLGEFLLPPLAAGDNLNHVAWIDATGTRESPLTLVDVSQQSDVIAPGATASQPWGYALLGDRIRLYPQPSELGTLRFTYPRRHPELCTDTTGNAPTVISIADAGSGYTRFTLGTTAPFQAGQYVDLVSDQYPYRSVFSDLYAGAVSGVTVDLYVPYSYAAAIAVGGMRVVRAGQLPYVQLPLEFRNCLTWQIAGDVLNELGDLTQASAAYACAEKALARVLGITARRVKATRPKIINRYSLARQSLRRGMREDRFP